MTFVGRIHVKQEDPPFLSRCIQDRDNEFYGIELRNEGTTRVKYERSGQSFFMICPHGFRWHVHGMTLIDFCENTTNILLARRETTKKGHM